MSGCLCWPAPQIFALRVISNNDLRIVLINKDGKLNCNVRVKLSGKKYCRTAALSRLLPGPDGIYSKSGITWQGQTYEGAGQEGFIAGEKQNEWVQKTVFKDGSCGFEVPMPAASAAMIVANNRF